MASSDKDESSPYQLDFTHFLNFPEQLAVRLQTHSSIGNFICHLTGTPMLGVAIFGLLQLAGGTILAVLELAMVVMFTFINDPIFGTFYALFSAITTYIQLTYFAPLSLGVCLTLLAIATLIQVVVGHGVFEATYAEPGVPYKGTGTLFSMVILLTDIVCASFHFYSMLALKLGVRPRLQADVNQVVYKMSQVTGGAKRK